MQDYQKFHLYVQVEANDPFTRGEWFRVTYYPLEFLASGLRLMRVVDRYGDETENAMAAPFVDHLRERAAKSRIQYLRYVIENDHDPLEIIEPEYEDLAWYGNLLLHQSEFGVTVDAYRHSNGRNYSTHVAYIPDAVKKELGMQALYRPVEPSEIWTLSAFPTLEDLDRVVREAYRGNGSDFTLRPYTAARSEGVPEATHTLYVYVRYRQAKLRSSAYLRHEAMSLLLEDSDG